MFFPFYLSLLKKNIDIFQLVIYMLWINIQYLRYLWYRERSCFAWKRKPSTGALGWSGWQAVPHSMYNRTLSSAYIYMYIYIHCLLSLYFLLYFILHLEIEEKSIKDKLLWYLVPMFKRNVVSWYLWMNCFFLEPEADDWGQQYQAKYTQL